MFSTSRLVAVLAVLALLAWIAWSLIDFGGEQARNAVERLNNEAANQADTDRLGYDTCIDGGFVWDFGAGKCAGPP